MDFDIRESLLTLGTTAAMLLGIALVLFFGPTLTIVGIVLITASAVLFILDATDIITKWRDTREA